MNTCKICGAKTSEIVHPRFEIVFHVCPSCELVTKDQKHLITMEEEKQIYDLHQNSDEDPGYVNYLRNFMEASILPYTKGGSLLEFGSGPNPVFSRILSDEGFLVSIYDLFYAPDKKVLEETYDVITAVEVVEHLRDPKAVFETFSKMLEDQGILALMTLFYPKDVKTFFEWFYIRDRSHVSFYSPKTIRVLGAMFGFDVIGCNHHRHITLRKK